MPTNYKPNKASIEIAYDKDEAFGLYLGNTNVVVERSTPNTTETYRFKIPDHKLYEDVLFLATQSKVTPKLKEDIRDMFYHVKYLKLKSKGE